MKIKDIFQTTQQIHGLEEKRRNFMRLGEGSKVEKRGKFKSTEQLDKEKMDAKWNTAKVREEMCLIHEAYQFFRMKYKNRYGDSIPSPNNFLK